jgi:hypothetical protein
MALFHQTVSFPRYDQIPSVLIILGYKPVQRGLVFIRKGVLDEFPNINRSVV